MSEDARQLMASRAVRELNAQARLKSNSLGIAVVSHHLIFQPDQIANPPCRDPSLVQSTQNEALDDKFVINNPHIALSSR